MATYKEIQKHIKEKNDVFVKTCWIADVKERCGFKMRNAPNRISCDKRTNPCPDDKVDFIKEALEYFGMI